MSLCGLKVGLGVIFRHASLLRRRDVVQMRDLDF